MKRYLAAFLLGVAAIVSLTSMLVHPYGLLKTVKSARPLLAGAEVNRAVLEIVERSCQNCHSERTRWPWYSYVAPGSWMVETDVGQARRRMNLSRWNEYTSEKKEELLTDLAIAVRSRQMPPARYTFLHPGSKLSSTEREQIYQWARTERRRLKSVSTDSIVSGSR